MARELGVKVYDKALLQAAACESGIDASLFEQADENESTSLFGNFFSISQVAAALTMTGSLRYRARRYAILRRTRVVL